jgi:hypothetical protein
MRARSFTGQVVAVLSRRTPAFQPRPGEPSTFPGRLHAAATLRKPPRITPAVRHRRSQGANPGTQVSTQDADAERGPDRLGRSAHTGIGEQVGDGSTPAVAAGRSVPLRIRRPALAAALLAAVALGLSNLIPASTRPAPTAITSAPPSVVQVLLTSDDLQGFHEKGSPSAGPAALGSLLLTGGDVAGSYIPGPSQSGSPASIAGCPILTNQLSGMRESAQVDLTSPDGGSVGEAAARFQDDGAAQALAELSDVPSACGAFTTVIDGFPGAITSAPLLLSPLAYPSASVRLTVNMMSGSHTLVTVYEDVVEIDIDNTLIILVVAGLTADSAMTQSIADQAVDKAVRSMS